MGGSEISPSLTKMPIYDYRCKSCNHEFDSFSSMDNRNNAICPKCEGSVSIVPSLSSFRMAVTCYVRSQEDGRILNSKQFPSGVEPPRPPTPEQRDHDLGDREIRAKEARDAVSSR